MAYLAFTGRNPNGNFQNNCKKLYIKYTPATPIAVPLGQEFDLALLFPGNPNFSAMFKTRNKGTFDVATRIPLSLLCCMFGLENKTNAYIEANSNQPTRTEEFTATGTIPATAIPGTGLNGTLNDIPPSSTNVPISGSSTFPSTEITLNGTVSILGAALVQNVVSVEFAIDLFPTGRIFNNGDLMDIRIQDMPADASIDIYVCDYPYMSTESKPYKYRTQTVLANNDFQMSSIGKIIFPNDPAKVDTIQMKGNTFVQWDLIDMKANAESDWVSNKTTYNSSPYIFLDTKMLSDVKLKALAGFEFYYKTEF